ncbi:MAG: SulP family inorganic anion transporter [Vicinamibacterales bacterium]
MLLSRLKQFLHVFDDRFEDLDRRTWKSIVYRDFSAGLIVAMTAIPMAMGFAMAMGMRPEQGIIAGAVACLVGRTFGGSKYQVYGPTAAFIPVIAGLMAKYDHGFLIFCSLLAGVILMIMGLAGMGRIVKLVPNSIVVGFTVGIGITIALTNLDAVLGIRVEGGGLLNVLGGIAGNITQVNVYALAIGLMTFLMTRYLLRISIFIPAPLIALGTATALGATAFAGSNLELIAHRYGEIPNDFFVFTPPRLPEFTGAVLADMSYYVIAIVFVSAVESLLCSSMADRLAGNKKTPFNPDKEFWGQGMVQVITPLINGFPCTGALARTATSIKSGAVTPLAGYFKFALKLAMAYYLASYLNLVPMACIGGILLWVSTNMVKPAEIRHVWAADRAHGLLMAYTAVMVPLTDFLTGVLSALFIYLIFHKKFGALPEPESPSRIHVNSTADPLPA